MPVGVRHRGPVGNGPGEEAKHSQSPLRVRIGGGVRVGGLKD